MSKLFCLYLLTCMIPMALSAQKKLDTKRFRNGTFKTVSVVSGTIIIKRHGAVQTETTIKQGINMVFDVKWLNDYTYTLKPQLQTMLKYKIPAKALLTVTITNVAKNSYFQITSSNLTPRKSGSEVIKIGP